MGNTHVKLFLITTSGPNGDIVLSFFSDKTFLGTVAILFSEAVPICAILVESIMLNIHVKSNLDEWVRRCLFQELLRKNYI